MTIHPLNQQKLIDLLEPIIDSSNLYDVVAAIGLICFEKAEHVQCNYQDKNLVKLLERNGKKIMTLAEKLES